jgi:putative CocE/NonD family hydrolase
MIRDGEWYMAILSRLVAKMAALEPAETQQVVVARDVPVTMPDGVVLLGDHYAPQGLGPRPTVLVRSPYGRAGYTGLIFGWPIAERGFHVFIQSCRGTFGSGGKLEPLRHERADGLATVAWLKEQPWFDGRLATAGQSYLGMTQWAIAADLGDELQAMTTWISSAEFRSLTYPNGSLFLETVLFWTQLVHAQDSSRFGTLGHLLTQVLTGNRRLKAAFHHLPLNEGDRVATGQTIDFYQDWLAHNLPDDDYWAPADFTGRVPEITAPNHLIGGWYDILLPQTLREYTTLKTADRQPYLTIGPWPHTDMALTTYALRETIAWFRALLLDDRSGLREQPVRIHVMGADEWRDFPDWPPAGVRPQRWYLHPAERLAPQPPPASDPDRYVYDPGDPTPNVGGAVLGGVAGPQDNRELEARPDVLTYTSAPLTETLTLIGPVAAELFVRPGREHADFFARLCVVEPEGKSTNLCDGLVRVAPGRPAADADGCLCVRIELWPTAVRFRPGQRLRLQVSSGAFPRYARQPGTGEPLGTARILYPAVQHIYHDPARPSAVILPVI